MLEAVTLMVGCKSLSPLASVFPLLPLPGVRLPWVWVTWLPPDIARLGVKIPPWTSAGVAVGGTGNGVAGTGVTAKKSGVDGDGNATTQSTVVFSRLVWLMRCILALASASDYLSHQKYMASQVCC